jgi:hypothetical protein
MNDKSVAFALTAPDVNDETCSTDHWVVHFRLILIH